jgi:uncharacterized repeat protein (TIGR01451 family)
MRKRFRRALLAAGALGVGLVAVVAFAGATTSLPPSGNAITPTFITGSSVFADCTTAPTGETHIFGLGVEKGSVTDYNGAWSKSNTSHTHGDDNPLQVTISNAKVTNGVATFDWSANMPVDYVFVKAGTGANKYDYSAYAWGGHPATGPWGDTGLVSPNNSISHILFCSIKKLRVEKTAVPSFTREYKWTIDKKVKTAGSFGDSAALSLDVGSTGTADWQISVDQTGSADTNVKVAGVITVLDSSPFDAAGVLDESLSNVTFTGACSPKSGTNDQATFSVGKGKTITCSYSAALAPKADGTNTVVAVPTTPDWMTSATASKAYTFGAPTSEINKTVNWLDSNGQSKNGITADDTSTYQTTNACGANRKVTNTVNLYGDSKDALGTDTATLDITCTPVQKLQISKTVDTTSSKRTWSWTIDKQVKTTGEYAESAALKLDPGSSGPAHYKVTVHGSSVDSSYTVSGTITVKNPNTSAVSGVSVTDVLPGAVVNCPATTIAGKGELKCTYTAASESTKPTSNTASVSVSGNSSLNNTSSAVAITFGPPTVINDTVDVTDAFDGAAALPVAGGTGLTPAGLDQNGDKVLTYDRTLTCGSTHTYGNTATVADVKGNALGKDSASVAVTCSAPKALAVTKTANPSFTRTYHWKVTKTADPSSLNLEDGATGSSTWTVTLEQDGAPVDSGWRLAGTITITNPNGFAVNGVSVSDGLGGTVTCPSSTIAASSSMPCSYSVGLQSGSSGTNTATATTATQGVGSGSGSAHYAFTEPTTTENQNVDVVDTNGKTWNDRTEGFTESYPTGTLPCQDATYTNTARVIGDGGAILSTSTATVTVTCSTTPPSPPVVPPKPVVDIGVTKSATTPTKLNGNVTYTIVVSSLGPDAASGAQVADPAPGGISYLSASSSDAAVTCAVEQNGALVSCSRPGAFNPGQSFVVTVVGKATKTGTLTNTVTVSTPGDSKPSNNEASASTVVVGPVTPPTPKPKPKPQICATLTVAPKTVTVGKGGKLTLTVKAGGKPVAGAKIRIKGAGVDKVVKTGKNGVVTTTVSAPKSGIVVISISDKKGCNTARVGVVGAYEPPVTG